MKNDPESHQDTKFTGMVVYGILLTWFTFALNMGWQGRYVTGPHTPPLALGLTLVVPLSFFIFAYLRRGAIWAFCQTLDLRLVVAVHLWRIGAIDFLLCAAEGRLPAGFALPAGIGDIVAGVAAIPLALAISSGSSFAKKRFVAWNIWGLADLILAVSLGILHSPSPAGLLTGSGPATSLMAELPRCMVPTFFVPLYILLHLLALARRKEVTATSANEKAEEVGFRREILANS